MPDSNFIITTGNSFNSVEMDATTPALVEAVDHYHKSLDTVIHLQTVLPIILDTNVLLRGYSIPPNKRELLIRFFSEQKDNIIVTKQIQDEFDHNREKIKKDFEHSPEVHISDLSDQLATLQLILKDDNSEAPEHDKDELFELFNRFEKIDNLSADEKQFLKNEFDDLRKNIHKDQLKSKNYNTIFPGIGDILEKPNFPYGDYFLFHEMLKFVSEKNTALLFLTFDVAKGDWIQSDGKPHLLYIQKSFAMTGQHIFIVDANHFLEKKYGTSFDSLVAEEKVVPRKVVLKSELEEELTMLFTRLERTLQRIARKFNIEESEDTSSKKILDELNYDEIITDEVYYELKGIWAIRDELVEGDINVIRRGYTQEELKEVLEIVKGNLRGIGRL